MNKPPNAYILFRKKIYKQTKEDNPSLSFSDLSKLLGKKWKELDKDEKNIYYNEAYRLKTIYEENKNK